MNDFPPGVLVRVTDPAHLQYGRVGRVWDLSPDYVVIDFHQANVLTVVPHNAIEWMEK